MNKFFEFVSRFTTLSAQSREALSEIAERQALPKGYLLLRPGTVCHYIYFVEAGLTRTFYSKDEKDVTDWFSAENSFACSVMSFISQQPDRRAIELLEPSVLWAFHYDNLERLYTRYHEIEHLGRHLVNFGVIQMQQRFDSLHFASAYERYHALLKDQPGIIQRAPLGTIASYLGITQETLSRIRSQQ